MKALNEDRLDTGKMYFHGSMSPRKGELEKPSCRYPFYVTTDLGYAMAFANKDYSSCGGDRKLLFGSAGYVYPISINPAAQFLDFRRIETDRGETAREVAGILTRAVFDLTYDNWKSMFGKGKRLTDIWEFGASLASLVFDDKHAKKDPSTGIPLIHRTANDSELAAIKKMREWYGLVEEGESHEMLQVLFEGLHQLGYAGVITTETDVNPDGNHTVSTDCAVGIWDLDGFGLISGSALKYRFCKKIAASDSGSAQQKICDFIQKYNNLYRRRQ